MKSSAAEYSARQTHLRAADVQTRSGKRLHATVCGISFRRQKFMEKNIAAGTGTDAASCARCTKIADDRRRGC